MMKKDELTALRAEVKALKKEVAGLKEFIEAMYSSMVSEDEECDDFNGLGNTPFGRYNT